MDTSSAPKFYFLLFLLSILIVCSSGSFQSTTKYFLNRQYEQTFQTHHRQLTQTTQHDFTLPTTPVTNPVTTPVTNPVTTPAVGTVPIPPPSLSSPPLITIPPANPTTPITFPPATQNPVTPSIPVTNPVTTPSTTVPVANPATTYPSPTVGNPTTTTPAVVPPATTTNAPAVPGQSWCVAKSGAPVTAIQSALDYACGIGGADCSTIQQGANCYNPNSLQNHASYAFNSYYQKNPVQTSCDFGGAAMITNVNPSSGSCIFPTGSSSSSASPTTASPFTTTPMPTPTTESSSGAMPAGSFNPPTIPNASSPSLGGGIAGYGENPPIANISSGSGYGPNNLRPVIGCIIVLTSIISGHQWI
ncbi:hypothetical protein CASFOL_019700 [Castilleja foliolosa]|uniref:X8 domain-containing protein n=1 Tax=Castilleja foliolosa TaxID=1961234 RepID=A0ABD3CYR3_9LAMI